MKKLIILLVFAAFSCTSVYEKEMQKSAKSSSASGRINQSSDNNKELLKELD